MITLATDFGEPYPAAMKGVVARRTDADVTDIAHELPRQDPRAAAFWLRFVLPEFPPAVHCIVVDPGVGTDRKALVVRAGGHALVGPDNGVLFPPARALADGGDIEVFEVRVKDPASQTFHGRDVFAPVAADCHDVGIDDLHRLPALSPTREYADLAFPAPEVRDDGATAEVLVVDGFGNAVTNLAGTRVEGRDAVTVNGESVPVAPSYAHVGAGERLVTVGSHGQAELAVNRGRGDETFGLGPGDTVEFGW
ncbi:SAM hydrolase/SAM-dependent halogenase family protein [Halosegnis marinus]|uniref:S-adenosyl-l-methionine hydroxide adenosyltransferase family protein n=1 Tax=Halosegnis marinus TaxID=3034023 RepID=A0ABD5ZQ48_9EURY|nr:SAM-dependent chlorinase/fluorinase [Halosegnis sp. DT85]